jgi:hypothetical protein
MAERIGNKKEVQTENRVVDFSRVREKRLEQKKRRTERILCRNMVSVYSTTSGGKLFPLDLIEVSEGGCSFQVPADSWSNQLIKNDEIPLRIYFSHDTYLEVFAKIVHSSPSIENNRHHIRYGCNIDKTVKSYSVYKLFVQFLEEYSIQAHKDLGTASAFYI